MKKSILYLFAVSLFTFGCATSKNDHTSDESPQEQNEAESEMPSDTVETVKPQRPYKVKAQLGVAKDSKPIKILSAEVKGNLLYLEVTYGGGCGLHEFDFIGSTVVMKSLPPKRSVKLVHKCDSDPCESIVYQTIEVDMRELAYKQTVGSEIDLLLSGYKEPIKYIYE